MANQVSLLAYLQHGPPALPVINQGQSRENTTDRNYSVDDITHIGHWAAFNIDTIMQQHGHLLTNARIVDDPMPASPPQAINSKEGLRRRAFNYLSDWTRRSLRCGFQHLAMNNQLLNRTVVKFGEGDLARMIDMDIPDLAYFDPNLQALTRPNRLPGNLKPSYKWSLAMRDNNPTPYDQKQFRQALSQVNWCMRQHNTRFGFILTDRELVAIRRLNEDGHLELSDSIPWTTQGNAAQPQLTVLLGLWYLGMLASDNQQWRFA
jgi:hypothetical protein